MGWFKCIVPSDGVFIVTSNGLCYMQADGTIQCLENFPYSNNFDMVCNDDGTCWILCSAGIYIADSENLIANQEREYPLINSKRGFRASLVANSWMCEEDNYLYLCCDSGVVKVNMKQYDRCRTDPFPCELFGRLFLLF